MQRCGSNFLKEELSVLRLRTFRQQQTVRTMRTDMYATFAKEAREEGFDDIAEKFEGVGAIEKSMKQDI